MVHKPIGQILKELGLISEYDIQQALIQQKEKGGALGQIFLQNGLCTEDDLNRGLAKQRGMDFIDLEKAEIPPEVIDLVDANTAETFQIIPVSYDGTTLSVAISKPDNENVLNDLRFTLPKVPNFRALVSSEESIKKAFLRYYQHKDTAMSELFAGLGTEGAMGKAR